MGTATRMILARIIRPLKSRKVRVALATVAAAYLADAGLAVNDTVILAIVTTGVSIVLGIAIEDHGVKSSQLSDLSRQPDTAGGGRATDNGKVR